MSACRESLRASGGDGLCEAVLLRMLVAVWGFPSFRPGQLAALRAVLCGRSVLSILPTGGGKSLVYQAAALLLDGPVLVVSPLLALMDDQLAHLPPLLPGAALHSAQAAGAGAAAAEALRGGALKVLFLSPERALSRPFLQLAHSLPPGRRFAAACVDECHCVRCRLRGGGARGSRAPPAHAPPPPPLTRSPSLSTRPGAPPPPASGATTSGPRTTASATRWCPPCGCPWWWR